LRAVKFSYCQKRGQFIKLNIEGGNKMNRKRLEEIRDDLDSGIMPVKNPRECSSVDVKIFEILREVVYALLEEEKPTITDTEIPNLLKGDRFTAEQIVKLIKLVYRIK
jgi:hypothetical protein